VVACSIVTLFVPTRGFPIIAADNTTTIALITFAGIVAGVLGTYFGTKRVKSGKIITTEATQLWEESNSMRAELRAEVAALKEEIKLLKAENKEIKAENEILRQRIDELERVHG